MAGLGVSKRTMSIIFMVGVLVASLVSSIYIVLFTKVDSKEGFNKLEPIYDNTLCGCGSVHEVPIWPGSITADPVKTKTPIEETTSEQQEPTTTSSTSSKPNKYSFLENKIEVKETPVVTPQVQRKFLSDLVISNGKRPPITTTEQLKRPKAISDGLGFNTGAIN